MKPIWQFAFVAVIPVAVMGQPAAAQNENDEAIEEESFCPLVGIRLTFDYVSERGIEHKPIPKSVAELYEDRCYQDTARGALLNYHKQFGTPKSATSALAYIQQKQFGDEPLDGTQYVEVLPEAWKAAVAEIENYLIQNNTDFAQALTDREKWEDIGNLPTVLEFGNLNAKLRQRMTLGENYLLLAEAVRSPELMQQGARLVSWYGTAARFVRFTDQTSDAERLLRIYANRWYEERDQAFITQDVKHDYILAFLRLDFDRSRANLTEFDKAATAALHPDFVKYAERTSDNCAAPDLAYNDDTTLCQVTGFGGSAILYYYYTGLAKKIVSEDFSYLRSEEEKPSFVSNGVYENSFLSRETEQDPGRFSSIFGDYQLARFRIEYDNKLEDCQERLEDGDGREGDDFQDLLLEFRDIEPVIDPVKQVSQYRQMASYYMRTLELADTCDEDEVELYSEGRRLQTLFRNYLSDIK